MDYDTLTIDLTAARNTPAELVVPYRRLVATYVPSPFTVRLGAPTAPPLVVRRPGVVCSCAGSIGRAYVTNDAGTGSAELFASDDLTADFPGERQSSSPPAVTLAHVLPGAIDALNPGSAYLTVANAGQERDPAVPVMGTRLAPPAAQSARIWGKPFSVIPNHFNPGAISPGGGRWHLSDRAYWQLGAGSARGGFGWWSNDYTQEKPYGAGFVVDGDARLRAALIRYSDGTPWDPSLYVVDVDLDVQAAGWLDLALDLGDVGGVPYLAWSVGGVELYRHVGTIAPEFYLGGAIGVYPGWLLYGLAGTPYVWPLQGPGMRFMYYPAE